MNSRSCCLCINSRCTSCAWCSSLPFLQVYRVRHSGRVHRLHPFCPLHQEAQEHPECHFHPGKSNREVRDLKNKPLPFIWGNESGQTSLEEVSEDVYITTYTLAFWAWISFCSILTRLSLKRREFPLSDGFQQGIAIHLLDVLKYYEVDTESVKWTRFCYFTFCKGVSVHRLKVDADCKGLLNSAVKK